jgi:GAF domain-containing protein
VAGGAASAEVFSAIAEEVADVLGLRLVHLWRYEADGTATVLGAWGERPQPYPVGSNWRFDDPTIGGLVQEMRAGRPVRIDDFSNVAGAAADTGRTMGITATAGAPIVVDGELWGLMAAAATDGEPCPTTSRIGSPNSRSWSPPRSRTRREGSSLPASRTSRPPCDVSRR